MKGPAAGAARRGFDWPVFILVACVSVALLLLRQRLGAGPLLSDTDDAMRMVVVRDVLAGQGWQDLVQHRLNPPFGAEIHWSRLVDLPLALMIAALTPFAGAAGAEALAATIWPLALFVLLLYLSARLCLRLVGPAGLLPGLVLPALSPAVVAEFLPGRIDHHNVQIVLTLAIAWASIEALRSGRAAAIAGLLCASALAIGTEALPAITAAILGIGIGWVIDPGRARRLALFGLAFAGGTLTHLALALPPGRWLEPACDALSGSYGLAALLTGAAFLALSRLPRDRGGWPARLALGAVTGLAVLGALFVFAPGCLGGPYGGLDPWLSRFWLGTIAEAKPLWRSLADLPGFTLAVALPPILGLGVVLYRLRRGLPDRDAWLVLGLFILATALIMLVQVRGARLAGMPVVPAAAWFIALAFKDARARFAPVAVFTLGALVFATTPVMLAVDLLAPRPAAEGPDRAQCLMPRAFAELAALPPQRVLAPIDLGAHLLLETPHSVLAAPYHRNMQGVGDTFRAFNAPEAEARALLAARGVSLVVVCPAMAEMAGLDDAAPDSLVRLIAAERPPAWLVPLAGPGPLRLYAVPADR